MMAELTPEQRAEIEALRDELYERLSQSCFNWLNENISNQKRGVMTTDEVNARLQMGLLPECGARIAIERENGETQWGTAYSNPPEIVGNEIVNSFRFVPDMQFDIVTDTETGESQMTVTGTAEQLEGFSASDNSI